MASEQDLPSEISDYTTRAQGLEATRQALVDRILVVVKAQIIPELIPLLPPRYRIDTDRTEVRGVGGDPLSHSNIHNLTHGAVPTGFGVYLRLLYNGRPTGLTNEARNDIGRIQKDLNPKLEELAQRYRLDSIVPLGKSISM